MKSNASSPAAYIAELDEPRKTAIKQLDTIIRQTVPELVPYMNYGMLGYGPYHYKYASGREGDWSVIGLASQKNYISLYICAIRDGQYLAEAHRQQLPKASIGRSCIRFKKLEDLDLKVIKNLLKEAAQLVKDGNFAV